MDKTKRGQTTIATIIAMKAPRIVSTCVFVICILVGCSRESQDKSPSRSGVAPQSVTVASQTSVVADNIVVVNAPDSRKSIQDDGLWSSSAIQKDPEGFIREQIAQCDRLKAKIEAQRITLTRMGKQSARTIEESDGMVARYSAFLQKAKTAYKAAEASGQWPATVDGFTLDEEQLSDRIADALERIELAKKDKETNEAVTKKVSIRQGVLKTKARELSSLRLKLVQQAEQVKVNAALAEIGDLSSVLGTLKDMTLEIDEDPGQLSLDDLTSGNPDAAKKSAVRAFLDE